MFIRNILVVSAAVASLAACAKNEIPLKHPFKSPFIKITPQKTASVATTTTATPAKAKPAPVAVAAAAPAPKTTPVKKPGAAFLASLTTPKPADLPKADVVAAAPTDAVRLSDIVDVSAIATAMRPSNANADCHRSLSGGIPNRSGGAASGSEVMATAMALDGTNRDRYIADQLKAGNVPSFMRGLTPVTFEGTARDGKTLEVTICVTPDYLAVGNDQDFVRVPMGLPAAADVANDFGFMLPTTKMVDAIYTQAGLRLAPSPMTPGSQMSSTDYLWQHNLTVENQRKATRGGRSMLVAGQKKDLVLSNTLRTSPGRVAIYGWHRKNGAPIQPLSTVHGESYADYSHGIRLVSTTAYLNGAPQPLARLLEDPDVAALLSKEGPIARPLRLMASLR